MLLNAADMDGDGVLTLIEWMSATVYIPEEQVGAGAVVVLFLSTSCCASANPRRPHSTSFSLHLPTILPAALTVTLFTRLVPAQPTARRPAVRGLCLRRHRPRRLSGPWRAGGLPRSHGGGGRRRGGQAAGRRHTAGGGR